MKKYWFTLSVIIGLTGLSAASVASLPTWHLLEPHRCAMIVLPPSGHPVTIRLTDGQQQVFLLKTLDASNGIREKIDFSAMPIGRYSLEVYYNQQPFYKLVHVHANQVTDQDASVGFRMAQHHQF